MSYLLDKKTKRKKILLYASFALLFLVILYFRAGIFRGLAYVSQIVFRPVLIAGDALGEKFYNLSYFLESKNTLLKENQALQLELDQKNSTLSNYNSVLADSQSMKEILGRKNTKVSMIISAILSKPNHSPYDTLLIDAGAKDGVLEGQRVFALGNIPIGRVAEVGPSTSKVILFSNPGEKTDVAVSKGVFLEAIGRGGGNFEISLPKDFSLSNGTEVLLPGINNYVLGIVQTTISDPRDSFVKALLASPVNIQELKFVEVQAN